MTNEIQRALGRLEGDVGGIKSDVSAIRSDMKELRADINGVKKRTYAHAGIFSIIVAFLTAKLTGH